jgi:dolichyl-phosphate beta-glucosyltransferase
MLFRRLNGKCQDNGILSVVMGYYNNRDVALKNIVILDGFLSKHFRKYEIILVDDGSAPNQQLVSTEVPSSVCIFRVDKNTGKGNAVKQGMLIAKGDCRIFTDIDLPYNLSAIPYAYKLITMDGFDFVAGDRTLRHSEYHAELPFSRKLASRFFSKCVTLLVIGGIFDSQCGFKAFSGTLASQLFPLVTIKRFSFDVEIYYILLKYNILIKRIPIRLHNHETSTVDILRHAFGMALEVMAIPIKWKLGWYRSKELENFEGECYWKKLESFEQSNA